MLTIYPTASCKCNKNYFCFRSSTRDVVCLSDATKNNNDKKITIVGIGVFASLSALLIAGILSKKSFSKAISQKGMEYKDSILTYKDTNKPFTGKIKINVGDFGVDKVETRQFKDGIITEITHKNLFGEELDGVFYKDGKKYSEVTIESSLRHKYFSYTDFQESGDIHGIGHGKCKHKKESVFDIFRNAIKNDWPENKK